MLIDSAVEAAVPADHVNRARDFYADKLGLTPVSEFAGVQLSDRPAGPPPRNPQSEGMQFLVRRHRPKAQVDGNSRTAVNLPRPR